MTGPKVLGRWTKIAITEGCIVCAWAMFAHALINSTGLFWLGFLGWFVILGTVFRSLYVCVTKWIEADTMRGWYAQAYPNDFVETSMFLGLKEKETWDRLQTVQRIKDRPDFQALGVTPLQYVVARDIV